MATRTFGVLLMDSARALTLTLVGIALGIATPSARAQTIQTYILDVSGQDSYLTYRVPPPVLGFFGPKGLSIPDNGLPTGGLPGVVRLTTATSGVLTDAGSAAGSGNSSFGPWSASGSSKANATYGKVGAQGSGSRINIGDGSTVVGFEGFGVFTERFTIYSPSLNGSAGSVVFHFTVDGTITATNAGTVGVAVEYQQNSAPIFSLMEAIRQGDGSTAFLPGSGLGHDGFSISSTSISGSGVFDTNRLDLTYGSGFDLKVGLLAYAMPRNGTASSDFGSTALLTGITAYDSRGNRIDDFSIGSGSGTLYDANGVHFAEVPVAAVPAPATFALFGAGAVSLFARRLLRRDKPGLP